MLQSINEAKQLLQKIQFLINNLPADTEPSAIELDLIREYLRKMYAITYDWHNVKPDVMNSDSDQKIVRQEAPQITTTADTSKKENIVAKEEIEAPEMLQENNTTESSSDPAGALADRVEKTMHFLNEKLAAEKEILADKIKTRKADDLRTAIDLNEKFFFINELFKGDALAFDKSIRFLNGLTSMQDAMVYIEKELGVNYDWKSKKEATEKFIKAISVKY